MKTRYGWVEIDGIRYDHDVILHADRTVTRRSKKKSRKLKKQYGHTPLSEPELEFLALENPLIIYIGTGQYGDLPITLDAHRVLRNYESLIRPTPDILEPMADDPRPSVAILHVSC
jgi:hypothetical protein